MRTFECENGGAAWGAWRVYPESAKQAGVPVVQEEMKSELRSVGPHSWFSGFARWNQSAERDRLAVVVEGSGWAVDDRRRVRLDAGQGAFWRRGQWSAFGADGDGPPALKNFCRMLTLAGDELSLERFLTESAHAYKSGGVPVELEPALKTPSMQLFDCGSGARARERYETYVAAATAAGALTERGQAACPHITGGHPWNSDHLAVFVEGRGWAADDRSRRLLAEGQGVCWPAGGWFAIGSDSQCRVLSVGANGLSVDNFLAGAA